MVATLQRPHLGSAGIGELGRQQIFHSADCTVAVDSGLRLAGDCCRLGQEIDLGNGRIAVDRSSIAPALVVGRIKVAGCQLFGAVVGDIGLAFEARGAVTRLVFAPATGRCLPWHSNIETLFQYRNFAVLYSLWMAVCYQHAVFCRTQRHHCLTPYRACHRGSTGRNDSARHFLQSFAGVGGELARASGVGSAVWRHAHA